MSDTDPDEEPERRDQPKRSSDTSDGGKEDQPSPAQDEGEYVCEICGSVMMERHCKIVCPTCGYQRDCSDP